MNCEQAAITTYQIYIFLTVDFMDFGNIMGPNENGKSSRCIYNVPNLHLHFLDGGFYGFRNIMAFLIENGKPSRWILWIS